MLDQLWTFMQTLGKGVIQGTKQYIDNDLQDYLPLFLFAAIAIIFTLVKKFIRKNKSKTAQ